MRIVRIVAGNIWRFWFFFEAVVTFFLLYPFFYFTLRGESKYEKALWWMRLHARLIVFLAGIKVEVIQRYHPKAKETYVICPNHISYLDIVLMYVAFPHYFHFMGKAELTRVPFFNVFFKKMNIGVERSSRSGSHKAYLRASEDLKKNISISIFPEATIPDCNPKLGAMKNGAFKLALENRVNILPICYIDNWKILPDCPHKLLGGWPGKARVVIDKPIDISNFVDADVRALKQEYQHRMNAILTAYCYGNKESKAYEKS
jgi:1-acyl-sn-glycerol-3-phosphate acyltransferase